MKHIVTIGEFTAEQQKHIDREFSRHSVEEALADETLIGAVGGIITRSNYTVPEDLILRLPALKIIATCGVGYDGIPLRLARQRGIVVTNTPRLLDGAVAELGIGMLLCLLRRLHAADRFVRDGLWEASAFPWGTSLEGKTVGIVGLGRVGSAVAKRLVPFEVEIAYSGTRKADTAYRHVAAVRDLAALSDILFLCCPGGQETRHLIDAEVLQALGRDGYLVNLARGSVVDEEALIDALRAGTIRGAALDVYADEPHVPTALRLLDNTLLMPHIGSATHETRAAMLRLTIDNLRAVLAGKPPLTPV